MLRLSTCSLVALLSACGGEPLEPPTGDELSRVPGRHALRRLNNSEYDRTVRDLLGTTSQPALGFPADDSSHGFDNASDALAVSPLWVEAVEGAGSALARQVVDEPLEAPITETWNAASSEWQSSDECNGPFLDLFAFWCSGTLTRTVTVPEEGTWRFTARVAANQAGEEDAIAVFKVDESHELIQPITAVYGEEWVDLVLDAPLAAGSHTLSLEFANDYLDVETGDDRNLMMDNIEMHGPTPFIPTDDSPWHRVMLCRPEGADARDCAQRILEAFVPKAWRRPASPEEIARLMAVYDTVVDAGDSTYWGVEFAVRATLTSPSFLFLQEGESPDGTVTDHELAQRMSYLLWSSMPDDELRALADDGALSDPAIIAEQVRRMTRDPRASALVDDFAGQWLLIRAVEDAFPDVWFFPLFEPQLRDSMRGQMEAFFTSFVGKDRSLRELLTSEIGYIDDNLAAFYGVDSQTRPGFRSYNLSEVDRFGWLAQAGLQMSLSYPTRTSPVRRGVWVLGNLLCEEPKPPPPGVEGIEESTVDATTLRGQLEEHRANPGCAVCHNDIDPIGFAFEHYDGIGHYRATDNGAPVDASAELPDGRKLDGLTELSRILAEDERYSRCIVEKGFTYALGRPPEESEEGIVEDIHTEFVSHDMTLDALWTAIVRSPSFLKRGAP